MKIIVTCYALSSGVDVVDMQDKGGYFTGVGKYHYFLKSDKAHQSKELAKLAVIKMADKRRKSLEKQLSGLDAKTEQALRDIESIDLPVPTPSQMHQPI